METISRALATSASRCSREIKRSSLQLCSWGQSSCLPGTLPSFPHTGQAPRERDGGGHQQTHTRGADGSPKLGLCSRSALASLTLWGPPGFSRFSWRPPEGQEALSLSTVNNGIQSGDSFQGRRAEQQSPGLPRPVLLGSALGGVPSRTLKGPKRRRCTPWSHRACLLEGKMSKE